MRKSKPEPPQQKKEFFDLLNLAVRKGEKVKVGRGIVEAEKLISKFGKI